MEVEASRCRRSRLCDLQAKCLAAACLQIIDTDFAFRPKSYATHVKQQLETQLQAAAAQAGMKPTLKCGAFEILKIITDSLKMLKEVTGKENLVLAAARRTGILAWRPDLKA